MRRMQTISVAATLLCVLPTAFATVRTHRHGGTHAIASRAAAHSSHAGHLSDRPAYGISSERATEIQSALIQRGYLSGEPTGTWDAASFAAMQKMQSDNGWQTKLVPDSRALIKLGLGPNSNPTPSAGTSIEAQASTNTVAR